MKAFIEWIKESYKLIVTIIGVLGILGTTLAIVSQVATAEDVKKVEQKTDAKIQASEAKTAKALDTINKSVQWQFDMQRYKDLDMKSRDLDIDLEGDISSAKRAKIKAQKVQVDKERDRLLEKISKTPVE